VTSNVVLSPADLIERFAVADIEADRDLQRHMAELSPPVQD